MGEHCSATVIHFCIYGGNEQSTHKYVSELMGKETIDTNTYGKSTGHSGNYSTNYQNIGRELLTPDEVRLLDNQYALLFIRGEMAIKDFKYDILKHPNVKETTDGEGKSYRHGNTKNSTGTIIFKDIILSNKTNEKSEKEFEFILLSEEEIEERILKEELNNEN